MPANEPDISALLEAYFDERLSPEERLLLEERLRHDPAARRAYMERAQWHATLAAWAEQSTGRKLALMQPGPRRRSDWRIGVLAAAAAIAVVVTIFHRMSDRGAAGLAHVSFQRHTAWPVEMRAGDYELKTGAVRFETAAGASVSVAAPARFSLASADRILLTSGRLTARMLHADARLTVKVGDLEVTDLGTAFGVDAGEASRALVSVFDGLVAVKSPHVSGELRLTEGESLLRLDARATAQKTEYDPLAFRELWPLTVGIDEGSHLVEFLPPGPLLRPLREYRANDRVFLFPEQQQAIVREPLTLDLSADARSWPECPVSPYPIDADARVSSYLVFFQPDPAVSVRLRRLTGEITFQHRVVGVICTDGVLDASDAALGIAGTDYSTPGQRRGLEATDQESYRGGRLPHDSITIGDDGRTVRFDLYVSNEREQMRVLVDPN